MSDTEDRESRTEEPTEKRITEAIEKGNIPFSREAVSFGSFLAITLVCMAFSDWTTRDVTIALRGIIDNAGSIRLEDREGAASYLVTVGLAIALAVLPVLAILACGSILASLLQNIPSVSSERVTPKLSRISPAAGWKRIFGRAGLVEFGKSLLKLAAAAVVTFFSIRNHLGELTRALYSDPSILPERILDMVSRIVMPLTLFSLFLALPDVTWSRIKWRKDLRMSRHDIKEEMRQAEGDPQIKARIRSIARQRASRRMAERLPTATMVIVNPTHYAVALRYVREDGC